MPSTSTITMLHQRPSSADAFQESAPQSPRLGQQPRSMYNGQASAATYRTSAPVQPYAFQSTPHLRHDARSISATGAPQLSNHAASVSISSGSSDNSSSKDDSVISSRAGSLINLSSAIPDLSLINLDQRTVKASPDRYRRPGQRRADSKEVVPGAQPVTESLAAPTVQRQPSVDDMAVRAPSESAKRYRRRSLNSLDTTNLLSQGDAQIVAKLQRPASSGPGMGATSTPTSINPTVFHRRTNSRDAQQSSPLASSTSVDRSAKPAADTRSESKGVNVPLRSSSTEPNKRITAPSPLSQRPIEPESPVASPPAKPRTYAAVAQAAVKPPSPAAQHLAAVSDKDLNKGMKSRLRRAFSFGSSQELRKASAQNLSAAHSATPTNEDDELDPEQQEIARRQEAAGIGAGIYSGQGGFTGSTDNISISSTASSASLMLRKMGQSARKGARSIKGLFRPKSVIGVPAADGPVQPQPAQTVQPSLAQVSMVTVEAERQRVNVNADPSERLGGGTGFPKLERNSIDTAQPIIPQARGSADGDSASSRRSIVGSDKDRAEVLAAVKKGILKRSGTESPVSRAGDIPQITESPVPSMPATPKDRTSSLNGNNDYFSPRLAPITTTKSMPNTPNGSIRSISFSPRIQFHDAWSATEYDRRGEIATCNRLTPMLAQQIKEELNNFKMVCLS